MASAKSGKARKSIAARRGDFLRHLARTANVSKSARSAGISTSTLYRHRAKTPSFAEQWDAALAAGLDELEQLVMERAKHGVERPVYFGGKKIGAIRSYSDALAMFVLRAKRPEIYGAPGDGAVPPAGEGAARDAVFARLDRLAEDEA